MENQNVIESANTLNVVINKVLYTGKVHVSGGREGFAKSSDGALNTALSSPGSTGKGTNPEQLFAAGWAACFIGAMKHNAPQLKIVLPADAAIDAEVDLALADSGFNLQARLNVVLPGLTYEEAKTVVEAAHQTCPYSKATRGNINVQINVAI
ncbi:MULTISPECIES: organic hydroperoxide resistance protein [unclassified Pedobacter]|uniref:organic hydroperoxide resistance protein n=1 Tax=unclassified Pedobacter TaxID=2628915 RepID=UPI001D536286|nr:MULTISPECIES: organic hydroperoxide resistance protein [unclassified Pedobacter]CAH0131268.1 Organic hydroperoxide resistance protein OhrB [Pedobacter sp. Bi126]CAH0227091.1 Organic hydroperoxide resistance protein OhrB [Pedobacter sp. Bi36]